VLKNSRPGLDSRFALNLSCGVLRHLALELAATLDFNL
jgi:hypothetical protein